MQLITINIWGGKVYKPLFKFISKHESKTDIFCFQEVFRSDRSTITHESHSNILADLIRALPDFTYYFSPTAKGHDTKGKVDFPLEFGQATFVRSGINILEQKEVFIHKKFNQIDDYYPDGRVNFPRNFIYTEIENNGKKLLILNVHGFWEPAPKYDTPQRFEQSQKIIDFIKEMGLPAVIAGDFNLRIDTQALRMFEDNKIRNLVKESKAPTTRSSLYDKEFRKFDKFADYILVTKGVWVYDFKVLQDEISDHLPLFLRFGV
jgi:endonuclease/exonuclease/phosphatase family metal-dependent hydrolase